MKRIRGRCKNGKEVEKLVTLEAASYTTALKTSIPMNRTRCRPVVVNRRTLSCSCTDKPQVLYKCLPGNLIQVEETRQRFNETSRACEMEAIKRVIPTGIFTV